MTSSTPAVDSTEKPRLWVVSELYYPELTSTGYYLTKIAEELSDDFEVKVICGQPNYSARGTTAKSREIFNGVEIFRVSGTRLNKNVIPYRLINMFTLGLFTFFRSVRSFKKDDLVLVVTNPPLMPYLISVASRFRGARQVLLIHDCYPEILYAAGKLKKGTVFANLLESSNRWLLRHADKLILVGRDMRSLVKGKLKVCPPTVVIPNWAELETVSPSPRCENPLLAELGLQDRFVLLYAGNMGYPNDIDTIISAAEVLQAENATAHFVFIGAGVKKPYLQRIVSEKNLTNVMILESRPRSNQQIFLNGCDVGIVSLVESMKGVSMPSRTYNILAAGKPILAICDVDSEVAFVVDEENAGLHVRPGDVDGFVEAVRRLSGDNERLTDQGLHARKAATTKYGLDTAISGYKKALIDTLGGESE